MNDDFRGPNGEDLHRLKTNCLHGCISEAEHAAIQRRWPATSKPIVILESPYACPFKCADPNCPQIVENVRYARAALRDCILRGEVPLASHLLYTQPGVLRDAVAEERQLGIDLGLALRNVAAKTVVYGELGVSAGMRYGIADAEKHGRPVEHRSLGEWIALAVGCRAATSHACDDPDCQRCQHLGGLR